MKRKSIHFTAVTLFTSLVVTISAWSAVSVPIDNPGFETDVLADGEQLGADENGPASWPGGYYESDDLDNWVSPYFENYSGAYNPAELDFGGSAPEGSNVGYAVAYDSYLDGMSQVLGEVLLADVSYNLSFKVGNPGGTNSGAATADYRVELVAGGTKLIEATGASPAADDWVTVTPPAYMSPGPGDPLIGQELEIRVMAADAAIGLELHFDEISLTRSGLPYPVAEPGGPYSLVPGGSLLLDGSSSQPAEGESLTDPGSYQWDLNNDGSFGDVVGATPAAISESELMTTWGMTTGSNTIGLRVTDSGPDVATAITTVTLGVTSYDSEDTSDDSWNVPGNWDVSVPAGTLAAIIKAGRTASAAGPTPGYGGGLTMEDGSTLVIRNVEGVENALGTGTITLDGATIDIQRGANLVLPAVNLVGDGILTATENPADDDDRDFGGAISGGGQLTIRARNKQYVDFSVGNSFSGGLVFETLDRCAARFQAAGSAGTGDVTVVARADGRYTGLILEAGNVFDDGATLTLAGTPGANSNWPNPSFGPALIDLGGHSDTVDLLVVNSIAKQAGSYGRIGTAASVDFQVSWIAGDGVLTVANGPADETPPTLDSMADNVAGGPIVATQSVTYTVTFSESMNPATVGPDDFGNASSTALTVGTVDPTGNPAVFEVAVTPTEAGTLQLQIEAGANLEDLAGNPMDTDSAIPGGGVISVDPLPDLVGELGIMSPAANGGTNPATGTPWRAGDSYRLAFVTSATHDAVSPDINVYNSWAQSLAVTAGLGGGSWKVIASSGTVAARDNTATNPDVDGAGVGIFLIDGLSMIAAGNSDLWDGGIAVPLDIDETGASVTGDSAVFAGTKSDGTICFDATDRHLGSTVNGRCQTGRWDITTRSWIYVYHEEVGQMKRFYVMSDPLTMVDASGGGDFAAWIGGFGLDPDDRGFGDDPDGDGLGNGIEGFFGSNPGVGNAGLTRVSRSGAVFSFEHPQADPALSDVSGSYEWSPDLETWYSVADPGIGTTVMIAATPDTPEDGTTTVEATIGGTPTPALFVRAVALQE